MKNVSKLFYAFVILLATVLTSCDKEIESSSLTIDKTKTGTIKGLVFADLDMTTYGYENVSTAATGAKVIVTMNYSELGLSTGGSLIDTIDIASDGSFEYEVPADANGVTVTAKIIDFVYDQKQEYGEQHATKKTVFQSTSVDFFVKANDVNIQEVYVEDYYTLGEIYDWYTVSGTIYANYDLQAAGNEKLPAGTVVTFYCNGWSKSYTVLSDGKYSISVPAYESVYIGYNFTLPGKLGDGTSVTYRYKGTEYDGYYSADTKGEDMNLGNGVAE
jgi:hypothetical protein